MQFFQVITFFKNGNLVAYHPGTIDPSKIDAKIYGYAMLFGALQINKLAE